MMQIHSKFILLRYIIPLMACLPLMLSAQEKVPPQDQQNILELPDFIIKGTGTLDIAGAKKLHSADDWNLDSTRLAALHPVPVAPMPEQPADSLRSSMVSAPDHLLMHAQIGLYQTPDGFLRYQTIQGPFDLTLRGDAASTKGSDSNASASLFGFSADAGWRAPENVEYFANARAGVALDLHNGEYNMYGSTSPLTQRQTKDAGMEISAAQDAGTFQFNASLLSRGYKVQDSLSSLDDQFGLQGGVSLIGNDWLANANVQFKTYSGSSSRNFSSLSVDAQRLTGWFHYAIGASIFSAQNTLYSSETYIAPFAEAQIPLANSLQFFARYAPRMEDETMQSVIAVNPYINISALDSIRYPYQTVNFTTGLRMQGTVSAEVNVRYIRTNNDLVFRYMPFNQWGLDFETTNLLAVQVQGAWQITPNDNASGMLMGRSNTLASNGSPVPYVAPVVMNLAYSHIFVMPLTIGGSLDVLGTRITGTDGSLPAAVLLNANATYNISTHVMLTAGLRNILNQTYSMWNGYIATKIFAAIGVTAAL